MKTIGRKTVYETKIKSRFEEIIKWLNEGASEKEIAKNLDVAYSTFNKYKAIEKEFSEILKKGRKRPVEDIKAAMFKRATGFQYEEKRVITQKIEYDDGGIIVPAKLIRTEVTTKTSLPDTAAGLVLLQHWAKDEGWSRDPQNLELKKKELELKEKAIEEGQW